MIGEIISSDKIIMREFVGDGTLGSGEKIQLSTTLKREPIVEFEDGSKFVVTWNELIELALQKKTDSPASKNQS